MPGAVRRRGWARFPGTGTDRAIGSCPLLRVDTGVGAGGVVTTGLQGWVRGVFDPFETPLTTFTRREPGW